MRSCHHYFLSKFWIIRILLGKGTYDLIILVGIPRYILLVSWESEYNQTGK